MKQSRRHELKTNELSIWLQQTYAAAIRNANYLIGGVVVAVLVLVAALYVQNRRHQAREDTWNQLYEFQKSQANEKPEILEQAKRFAEEHAGDSELGPRARLMVAQMATRSASGLDPLKDSAKRLALLKEARSNYQAVIDAHGDHPSVEAHARIGLASVLESLALAGEASADDARKQYQALEAMKEQGLYAQLAKSAASTLDERLKPLKLVATRPAEPTTTAPTTAPAVPVAEALPASAPATTKPMS